MKGEVWVMCFFDVGFSLLVREYGLWRKCGVWFVGGVGCGGV